MKCPSYNIFFETIASPLRIHILELLQKKPMCVSEITKATKEEQSKISHNLKKLYQCHFIGAERNGKQMIYSLNKETTVPLMKLVEKHVKKYCCSACERRM